MPFGEEVDALATPLAAGDVAGTPVAFELLVEEEVGAALVFLREETAVFFGTFPVEEAGPFFGVLLVLETPVLFTDVLAAA